MTKERIKILWTGMVLCLAAAGLAGCGSGDDEAAKGTVTGRLTSVSDSKIVLEVFTKPDGKERGAVSGSAAAFRPEGTPPSDGEKPQGTPPSDEKRPNGKDQRQKKGETKIFQINSDTVIYKMTGNEKTEIAMDDVELGSMLSVEADGDMASSITVENRQEGKRMREEN